MILFLSLSKDEDHAPAFFASGKLTTAFRCGSGGES